MSITYILVVVFHRQNQIKLKIKNLKSFYKTKSQHLNRTGSDRPDLGPHWSILVEIWGTTHVAALPSTVGVDVDPHTGMLTTAKGMYCACGQLGLFNICKPKVCLVERIPGLCYHDVGSMSKADR